MTERRVRRLRSVLERRQPDLTVLMEHVHKEHNFSAILRSCDAVGVLEAHAVPPLDGFQVHRASSSGSHKWVRTRIHPSAEAALEHLRGAGFHLVAAHPAPDAVDYADVDYTVPTAFVLGAELFGVSDACLAAADRTVTIPMVGMVQSLNVSVAAALLLYEARRQRSRAGLYASRRIPNDDFDRILFEWCEPDLAARLRAEGRPYPAPQPDEDSEAQG